MRAFWEVIEDCDLQDLGFSGLPFTWDNKQDGVENVKDPLDRALGNEALRQLFEVVRVKHISMVHSDHYMILTELKKDI